MRNFIYRSARVARGATLLLVLGASAAFAQQASDQKVPPPDSALRPPQAPSPALHAPVARGVKQAPVPAVVLPLTPASPRPPAPAAPKSFVDSTMRPAQVAPPSALPPRAALPTPRRAVSPGSRPEGATMQCKDGTYLSGPVQPAACDAHKGLAVVFPVHPPAPTPPAIP